MRQLLLVVVQASAWAVTTNLQVGRHDFILAGGAGFVPGHGAPTGMALRSGSPGQTTAASFPQLVLAPGATVQEVSMSYRYVTGYGAAGSGRGSNLSLSFSDEPRQASGHVVFHSPHYRDYAYAHNNSNYSKPVLVHVKGLAIRPSPKFTTRLQLGFSNNDRNLQLLVPLSVNITCTGAPTCLVPVPPPPPPPPPLPPQPPPPATHTPWTSIGPWNIGDDIHNGGEAGTIAPVVSSASQPSLLYMGGNNNAASSGVLKSVDFGKHWAKVNEGLFDTRIHGLFMVDLAGMHVLAGTPSGVFETINGGRNWTHVQQTRPWGVANSFANGTINGEAYLLVGMNSGLANVRVSRPGVPLTNATWQLIPSPPGHAAWRTNVVSVSDYRNGALLRNSVIGGCLWPDHSHGVVHTATLVSPTAANWSVQLDKPCQALAMDPNDADHMLVNNASNGLHIYESRDGGRSYHTCLNQRGAVMVAIDRRGWLYCASEGGALRNLGGCTEGKWEAYFVRRTWRRTGRVVDRVPHDYQRINVDVAGAGSVAFGSDQGMFLKNGSELQLYSADGDLNNNVIMHPAIAMGEAPNETCIVTALWDWSPVASWDSGRHWPSWQTEDDGSGMGYFGEGGGCFGVGESKHVLCMHHHNVAHSSRCGKNMTRFVAPHGASVGPPEFSRVHGSRTVPSGLVYAPMTMGHPPWETLADERLSCEGAAYRGDLGVHTRYSCLSHVDIGLEYGWWAGVNAAVWRGDSDGHCHLCTLAGNRSTWPLKQARGSIVYALLAKGSGADEGGEGAEEARGGEAEEAEEGDDEEAEEDREAFKYVSDSEDDEDEQGELAD